MIFPVVTMSRRNGECYFYDGVLYLIGITNIHTPLEVLLMFLHYIIDVFSFFLKVYNDNQYKRIVFRLLCGLMNKNKM